MITDADGKPRYYDKQWDNSLKAISPELKRLYVEMQNNPNYHISRECSFYPKGYPTHSPGWN